MALDITTPKLITDIGGQRWPNRGPAYMPEPSATMTLTIASGDSYTNVFEFVGYKNFGLQVPTAFDGAAFAVYGSIDEPANMSAMHVVENGGGNAIEFQFTAGNVCAPAPNAFYGLSAVRYVCLRTLTALGGGAQVQGADRSFSAMLMG